MQAGFREMEGGFVRFDVRGSIIEAKVSVSSIAGCPYKRRVETRANGRGVQGQVLCGL